MYPYIFVCFHRIVSGKSVISSHSHSRHEIIILNLNYYFTFKFELFIFQKTTNYEVTNYCTKYNLYCTGLSVLDNLFMFPFLVFFLLNILSCFHLNYYFIKLLKMYCFICFFNQLVLINPIIYTWIFWLQFINSSIHHMYFSLLNFNYSLQTNEH